MPSTPWTQIIDERLKDSAGTFYLRVEHDPDDPDNINIDVIEPHIYYDNYWMVKLKDEKIIARATHFEEVKKRLPVHLLPSHVQAKWQPH